MRPVLPKTPSGHSRGAEQSSFTLVSRAPSSWRLCALLVAQGSPLVPVRRQDVVVHVLLIVKPLPLKGAHQRSVHQGAQLIGPFPEPLAIECDTPSLPGHRLVRPPIDRDARSLAKGRRVVERCQQDLCLGQVSQLERGRVLDSARVKRQQVLFGTLKKPFRAALDDRQVA